MSGPLIPLDKEVEESSVQIFGRFDELILSMKIYVAENLREYSRKFLKIFRINFFQESIPRILEIFSRIS